jgi:hypothetical protein
MNNISAFTGKVPSDQDKFKVGFRVIEIPLGVIRNADKAGWVADGSGTRKLLDDLIFESDLVAISVNEFDGNLTPCKNTDGSYRKLVNKDVEIPQEEIK